MSAPAPFGIEEIVRRLPHRFPMLMLDRVLELEPGQRGTALKNVTGNEPHLQGHFPGAPIMPGVLTIEAMAQLAGVVLSAAEPAGSLAGAARPPYLVAVEKMTFRKPVVPGDTMVIQAEVVRRLGKMIRVKGEVRVAGERVASGELVVA